MIDEVFNLMKCFPNSRIVSCGEVILSEKGNVSFNVKGIEKKEDIVFKMLEWASRPIAKGCPYSTEKSNRMWRRSLLLGYNNYLQTHFTESDMYCIYDRLGNAVDHDLTIKFYESGYDMDVLVWKAGVNNE